MGVKPADDKEGDGNAEVDEVVHDDLMLRDDVAKRELKAGREASKRR